MSVPEIPDLGNRTTRRQRVLKQGKILLPNDMSVLDCGIRDISETGAKLMCADQGAIPNVFRLVITADRSMRDAEVVWRRPDMIGVRFTSPVRKAPLLKW